MANANTITLGGTLYGPDGNLSIQQQSVVGASNGLFQVTSYELTASPLTIAVPSWAVGVLISPAPLNANHLLFAMSSGDTLRHISPTQVSEIAFDAANVPADIYLESSTTDTTYTTVTFF
jgi:hypothetical protein